MKITLEYYDNIYTVECADAYTADKVKEVFSRMLVQAGYPPSVIDDSEGGGWVYLGENEMVVERKEEEC